MKFEPIGNIEAARGDRVAGRALSITNFHVLALTGFVFLAPNVIFATALQPAPAGLVLAGCGVLGALMLRMPVVAGSLLASPVDWPLFAACAALALTFCLLGGQGHFFYSPVDWLVRDAVLRDLIVNGANAVYRYHGQDYVLRAPLGLYMAPAMVGRTLGLQAAHIAMLAQNAFCVSMIAYFVASLAQVRKAPLLLLFFAFSGMDIVGVMAAEIVVYYRDHQLLSFDQIEWWLNVFTPVRMQISSHVTQLFWVPNHLLPGWWFGLLALLYARREVDLAFVMGTFPLLLLWSPLAMIGALPLLVLMALDRIRIAAFERRVWLAALGGIALLPIAIYLTTDSGQVPGGWLIGKEHFAWIYIVVIAIELPQIAIVGLGWRLLEPNDRRIMIVAMGTLLLLPLYSFGSFNDLSMRGSIAPLFLLAFAFARIAVLSANANGGFAAAIGAIVILSAVTPILELKGSLNPSFAISDCNLVTAWEKTFRRELPTNYWSRVEKTPSWLIEPELSAPLLLEDRKCWPDHPLLEEARK